MIESSGRPRMGPGGPDGRILAVLSMRDLLRDEIHEQSEEIQHLRAYVYQTPFA
jgi:hypothetical protein